MCSIFSRYFTLFFYGMPKTPIKKVSATKADKPATKADKSVKIVAKPKISSKTKEENISSAKEKDTSAKVLKSDELL